MIDGYQSINPYVSSTYDHIATIIKQALIKGISPDYLAAILTVNAIDCYRLNYGDDELRSTFVNIIDARLSRSIEDWGVVPINVKTED